MATTAKSERIGIIGAIIFHVIVILLLLYWKFITPLPLPAEQGIMIDFGADATGAGLEETQNLPQINQNNTPINQPDDENMTQDFEDAPTIDNKKNIPDNNQTNNETNTKKVDNGALFPGKSDNNNPNQGNTGNKGNQGVPTGNDNRNNEGNGGGGSGISLSLNGRTPVNGLMKPHYTVTEEGKVVVEIRVDQEGNVTSAEITRGTTTYNVTLQQAAIKAAKTTRFDKNPDAAPIQKGTITYNFKLN